MKFSPATKSYSGAKASQISFPLGGIGSGSVGLGGDGRLIDWEIFNRPSKNSRNGTSHFAVRAVSKGKLIDARALCGELPPPYMGTGIGIYHGFGYGPSSETLAGFPNFASAQFRAEMPFANLEFKDPAFPGKVSLTAFNPFIPLKEDDSSLPAAFFEIEFENPSREAIDYTAAFSVKNPARKSRNLIKSSRGLTLVQLTTEQFAKDAPEYGDISLATDAASANVQANWYRGGWCDSLEVYWKDFASAKKMPSRDYAEAGNWDHATLAATVRVAPRSRGKVRFVLTWNYPNNVNYWTPVPAGQPPLPGWKNYYATLYPDSTSSAKFALQNWDRLHAESDAFRAALHSSTLPAGMMQAISANLSILKSPTVLRLEDGSFYGWEGVHAAAGSCEGTCAHVWNYAYAMPFLFPKLERSIRELNWKYAMRPDGGLEFRLRIPLGIGLSGNRPCCDGQFGDVLKFYRDWKISGDPAWMKSLWPSVKKSIEFAWAPTNGDLWDPNKTGVLHGRQHHTLDMELFGPNSWLTGFYQGALKAGAEMADAVGEPETASEYRKIFQRGQKWVAKHLFNGQWFTQQVKLSDAKVLDPFGDATPTYWNAEHKELKYQLGDGISIDQVVAQWHANLCGLGSLFAPTQLRKALKAIHTHNFKRSMREITNTWRLYSLYDEAGVLICTWPKGTRKPVIPIPYNSETMYGFEYSAAALMIQEGLLKEGLEIVEKGRRRFEGDRRNPWNEFECGSNYARSMASYSLLNAMSGFEFDATKNMIGFSPQVAASKFRSFWSLASGWGTVEFAGGKVSLNVVAGQLDLSEFRSKRFKKVRQVKLNGHTIPFTLLSGALRFSTQVKIGAGESLDILQ